MPIQVPPELRENQLSVLIRGLDQFYADKVISYSQLEDHLRRMSDEDLEALLVYTSNADLAHIASAVLSERGTLEASVRSVDPPVTPEVLF